MLSYISYNNITVLYIKVLYIKVLYIKVLLITIYNVRGKGCQNFQDEMLTMSHD